MGWIAKLKWPDLMSIRSKLAWTFIILLIFGITAISSYSILFIRNFLLNEGVEEIKRDSQWMSATLSNIPEDSTFEAQINRIRQSAQYQLSLYDQNGKLFQQYPDSLQESVAPKIPAQIASQLDRQAVVVQNDSESEQLIAWSRLGYSQNRAHFLKISQYKDQFYQPIKTIRWIIYSGMFISMGLVILVSILFARYISRPIMQLKDAAREIAEGDVEREIHLDRNDEFGTLAHSLNEMASRLRADNEELKRINEQQRQFFADITHEIKNPLHTISGSLEMLQIDELPEGEKEKYILKAQKQTQRINSLYKDLVTLQRYESDDYFIEQKKFDLKEVATHVEELFQNRSDRKGLELGVDKHSCMVQADPQKIEQVLVNLVSNAIKYTTEGSVSVRYSKENSHVEITVRDTGTGIAEEHLGHLFDRFYRTDKARSRDKGGTGLGLSVVKSILKAHGQDISVKSEPGEGTEFRFRLPVALG